MAKFDLYARPEVRDQRRPWTPFRGLIWVMLVSALALWAYSLIVG